MEASIQLFVVLLVTGLMLVGAEIFVPGGVLGTIGGIALTIACVMSFFVFPVGYGVYITLGVVVLVGVVIAMWIKFFPRSYIGTRMTAGRDLLAAKGTQDGLSDLLGQEGEALCALRPSGFARIGGRRVDVITEGSTVGKGEKVKVVEIEGNRVVVRSVQPETSSSESS